MTGCMIDKGEKKVPAITVQHLKTLIDGGDTITIIDVREPNEHAICALPNSRLIPLATLADNASTLPKDGLVVVHCHHGGRSSRAVEYLAGQGIGNVVNLTGGIHAWSTEIDNNVPTY
jgi:rhodanese-related sulfurtransferase